MASVCGCTPGISLFIVAGVIALRQHEVYEECKLILNRGGDMVEVTALR